MAKTVVIIGNTKELVHSFIRGYLLKDYNVVSNQKFYETGSEGRDVYERGGRDRQGKASRVGIPTLRNPKSGKSGGAKPTEAKPGEGEKHPGKTAEQKDHDKDNGQQKLKTVSGEQGGADSEGHAGEQSGTHGKQKAFHHYALNSRSPLSVRSLLLEGLNTFGSLDEAVITVTFGEENRVLHDLPVTEIEKQIDATIKGSMYLLKELITYFWKQQRGTVSVVLYNKRSGLLLPLDALRYGAIRELTESIFTQYKNEPVILNGFESGSTNIDDFVSFVIRTQREKKTKTHGRWFAHTDKAGFLNSLSLPGLSKS